MAYAQVDDVQGRMAHSAIDATSTASSDQVERFLGDCAAEINAALSVRGVAVPVTTPLWYLDDLRSINADGATALTLRAIYPDTRGPGEVPAYAYFQKRYEMALAMIKDGSTVPAGLPAGAGRTFSSNYFTRNPQEEETLGDLEGEPLFKIGQRF